MEKLKEIDEALLLKTAEFSPEQINDFCMEEGEWEEPNMDWDDKVGYRKAGFRIDGKIRGFMWMFDWKVYGYSEDHGWGRDRCGLADDQNNRIGFFCSVDCGVYSIEESENMLPGLLERDEKGRIIFCGIHKDGVRHGLGSEFTYNENGEITEFQGLWQNGKLTHRRNGGKLIPME